jgi:hypothetical protein
MCQYTFLRGKKAGQKCTKRLYEGKKFCYKHSKTLVAKANVNGTTTNDIACDEVFGEPAIVPQPVAPRARSSVWTITINSNSALDTMATSTKKKFKKLIEYIFDQRRVYDFITDKNSPDDSRKNIISTDIDYTYERGPTNGFLHSHILLRIKHNGFLQLCINDIRALALKIFGKAVHIHAPVTYDAVEAYRAYIHKNEQRNVVDL